MTCEYRNLYNLVNDLYTLVIGWVGIYVSCLLAVLLLTVASEECCHALDMFCVNQINDTHSQKCERNQAKIMTPFSHGINKYKRINENIPLLRHLFD